MSTVNNNAESVLKINPSQNKSIVFLIFLVSFSLACSFTFDLQLTGKGRTLNVYADRGWQDTGVSFAKGEKVILTVKSGRWFEDPPGKWHDASGNPDPWICGDEECHEPLPIVPKYALIAKFGEEGLPFLVGDFSRFFAEGEGRLFLRANYGDQDIPVFHPEGSVNVRIEFD